MGGCDLCNALLKVKQIDPTGHGHTMGKLPGSSKPAIAPKSGATVRLRREAAWKAKTYTYRSYNRESIRLYAERYPGCAAGLLRLRGQREMGAGADLARRR